MTEGNIVPTPLPQADKRQGQKPPGSYYRYRSSIGTIRSLLPLLNPSFHLLLLNSIAMYKTVLPV
uniref:Uncharacterized protein n=1 Tax=Candidatus Kentrum sp. LFY TaxID=2126342 RepID=A0A450X1E4_9GAMM|nr:MAG: hypothetical protein BECKLFY1418C_GA0070996_113414 [Candidatus Kentron sp. LFY]